MRIDVVTVFPQYFSPLDLSLIGKARQRELLSLHVHDLRTYTHDVHRTVDDAPCGGGAGMIMKPEPWGEAFDDIAAGPQKPHLLVPSPAGTPFTQDMAASLATQPWLMFACARYEGLDQRVLDEAATMMRVTEVSLGDYVLFGGEVAALAIVEATTRLIPGVLGNADSLREESHSDGLLEAPSYTKPAVWRGREVPEVLLSGHHARIARWRRDEALLRTAKRRPDLLKELPDGDLDDMDLEVLRGAGVEPDAPGMAE